MQDSPPHSIAEIRRLVSRYLDGLLSPDDTALLDTLLVRFPIYQTELSALRAVREQVRDALENSGDPENKSGLPPKPDALWRDITARLDADDAQDLLAADPEFISAYYDGELSLFDSEGVERTAFEAQLYRNDEANRLLGVMAQVSEAVRQFGYRQENACTVDVTQQVMAALQQTAPDEVPPTLTLLPGGREDVESSSKKQQDLESPIQGAQSEMSLSPDALSASLTNEQVEMLSAYADQALTPRETIAVNRLVESESEAKTLLNNFNRLSDGIRAAAGRWQSQAPDCLPELRSSLKQVLRENMAIPVPLSARKKTLRILLPVAAAALLLLLSFPMLQIRPDAMSGSLVAFLPAEHRLDSTSLRESANSGSSSLSLLKESGDSLAIPSEPLLEPVSQARSVPMDRSVITDATEPRSPSSEEYLFNALNERNNREDVSGMLGE